LYPNSTIDEILVVDLHRWTSIRGWDVGWHQCLPSLHSTTLESNMSDFYGLSRPRTLDRRLAAACGAGGLILRQVALRTCATQDYHPIA